MTQKEPKSASLNVFALALIVITPMFLYININQSLAQTRPRIIITADPELDDANSLIRFLLWAYGSFQFAHCSLFHYGR